MQESKTEARQHDKLQSTHSDYEILTALWYSWKHHVFSTVLF